MRVLYGVVVCALLVWLLSPGWEASRRERMYQGDWHTTNRMLDGSMTCIVTELGNKKWQGRFYGVWQGVPFDHTVEFAGPPSALRGTATIDGAHYDWQGAFSDESPSRFTGSFGGARYTGHFDLRAKERPSSQ